MIRALTASVLLSLALNAQADEGKGKSEKAAEERVCFEQARTGSNIKRKVCMSKEEAEERRKADQAALEGMKRQGSRGVKRGAGPAPTN